MTGGPDLTYNGGLTDAFVAQVRADGTVLDYAGYIGGELADAGNGIAVDADGQAHVTGNTRSTEATFPVLRGPDLSHNGLQDAFAAKVASGGATLIYAGYVGGDRIDSGNAVALDEHGNAHLTGGTLSTEATFPVTGGDARGVFAGVRDAYVAQINPAGSTLTYAGYLGGDADDRGEGLAIGSDGGVFIAGQTTSTAATFPVTAGPDLTYNGGRDAFIAKIEITGPSITVEGIVNAATFVGGPIAPGEIISIFGVDIGPDPGVNTVFDENGNVLLEFAGVQVLINGVPAPLYFVGENQINCQVPYEVDGTAQVTVQVIFQGTASNIVTIDVADTAPGLFTLENGVGQVIAVLFPEGTLNTAENPVAPGQIVTLYGTGEGQTAPPGQTGVPVDVNALPVPIADVVVTIGGVAQEILYVGGAPGFAGLLQINIEIVAGTPAGEAVPIVVTIGGVGSAGALGPEVPEKAVKNDGEVTIAITQDPNNQGPMANGQMVMTDEDVALSITLTGSDPEGDPLTFTITRTPANGAVSAPVPTGPGSADVTYTPVANFNGMDSFDFQVMDPNGGSSMATVEIEVKPLPDPPVANNDSAVVVMNTPKVIDVLSNDFDPDGDALTISGVSTPTNGTAAPDGDGILYTPNTDYLGPDGFEYTISDQNGKALDTATVSVQVTRGRRADLSIAKTPAAASATAGAVLLYELEVANSGPSDASGVTVTDTFPADLSHKSNTCGATAGVGTVTWSVGVLPNGARATCTVTFNVSSAATANIVNQASVAGDQADPNSSNNVASTNNPITFDVMLAVTKVVDPMTPFRQGTMANYLVTVSHAGGASNANNVVVTDVLDPRLTFVSAGSSAACAGPPSGPGGTVTCSVATIPPTMSVTFTIKVMIEAIP